MSAELYRPRRRRRRSRLRHRLWRGLRMALPILAAVATALLAAGVVEVVEYDPRPERAPRAEPAPLPPGIDPHLLDDPAWMLPGAGAAPALPDELAPGEPLFEDAPGADVLPSVDAGPDAGAADGPARLEGPAPSEEPGAPEADGPAAALPFAAVPEPRSLLLVGAGLALLARRRRGISRPRGCRPEARRSWGAGSPRAARRRR